MPKIIHSTQPEIELIVVAVLFIILIAVILSIFKIIKYFFKIK